MHIAIRKHVARAIATLVLFPSISCAGNPTAPIRPADNIQDPGAATTAWGGCGPTDSNCYVDLNGGSASYSSLTVAGATALTGTTQINTTGTAATTIGNATATTTIAGPVNLSGAVTFTTLPALPLASGSLFIGNISNIAAPQTMSGDATLTNAGVLTLSDASVTLAKLAADAVTSTKIADATISNVDIATTAAIAYSKLALGNSIVLADLTTDSVNSTKLIDGSVAAADIAADAVTTSKILDGTIADADVSATAAIALSKLASGSNIVTSLAAPTGSQVNGGSIASNVLTLSFANGTNPGLVSISSQTFAGDKTLSGQTTLSPTSGTALTVNAAASANALNINGAANSLALQINASTTAGQSFGQILRAGSNASDYAFRVKNAADTAEYLYVRGDGNVGIGGTNPNAKLDISGIDGSTAIFVRSSDAGTIFDFTPIVDDLGGWLRMNNGAGAETIRLASGTGNSFINQGNVGIGTTSPGSNRLNIAYNGSGAAVAALALDDTASAGTGAQFLRFQAAGTTIGSVGNVGNTGVIYNTSSDRRIKDHITDTSLGLQDVLSIPVRDFIFRSDPTRTITTGFIAQELHDVFPSAVATNGDDGVVDLGDTKSVWSVDYGRVTPLLVKAVQDLAAITGTFRARLIDWLGSSGNGIVEIRAQRLCAGDVCVNAEQLAALLAAQGAQADHGSAIQAPAPVSSEPVVDIPLPDPPSPPDAVHRQPVVDPMLPISQ